MTFFLTMVFMVLVFWRPQDWLFPWMYGWPVLDGITFAALLSLLIEADERRIRFPTESPQSWLLVGFWFATLMSHVANTYFQGLVDTLFETFKFTLFGLLLMSVLSRPSRLRWTVRLFVAMACLMAVHAYMQATLGQGFAGSEPLYIPEILNKPAHTRTLFFGIFGDPNDLAQILVTAIPFTFLLSRRVTVFSVLSAFAISAFLIYAVFTTHSRGGLVALSVVGMLMFFLVLPSKWLPYLLLPGSAAALALCPLSAAYLDQSAYERVIFWGLANWRFKENLVFGIGYGMFWQVAEERSAHNAFVECYTTIGFFGYWFWFGLLLIGVLGAWRTNVALRGATGSEEVWLRRFSGLAIAATAGFLASAYFLSRSFVFPLFFLIAMLAAVPLMARKYTRQSYLSLVGTTEKVIVVCTVGAVVSILYIYFSILLLNKAVGGG
ncbi:MAG: hypothetical protein C0404_12995 [Verrucomicrobia bacterium]|nr:hypothetical protein [Verrucomicrobiota bacterium]